MFGHKIRNIRACLDAHE
jgi:hypothetical protein